jgi:hypothetical protein
MIYSKLDFVLLRCAGPGDIIALMGIAVQLKLDVFLYLPPHDDAQKWNANVHYKSLQFREAVALKKKPTIYLVIRGGHFKCLASASTAPTAKQAFSVLDLLQAETDPATSKYAFIDSQNGRPVCPKCVHISVIDPVAHIACV